MQATDTLILEQLYNQITETSTVDRIPLDQAREIAAEISVKLGIRLVFPENIGPDTVYIPNILIPTGSIRRKKSTIGDIDFVCTQDIDEHDVQQITGVEKVWSRGEKQIFFNYISDKSIFRSVNIFVLDEPASFGAFMMHTTGSNMFNIILRKSAKKRGFLINQYGLFDRVSRRFIAGNTEKSIFDSLGKIYKTPEERV